MRYQNFSPFGPWGANSWAKVHQKGRWPGGLRDLPSCKISPPYVHRRPRYPLPKFLRTNKQTVNDISPACLSACGDNKKIHITTSHYVETLAHYTVSKKLQNCFCQNFVKCPPVLIIFGRKMAKRLKLCEVYSFSTSSNLHHQTTVLNADVHCTKLLHIAFVFIITWCYVRGC